MKKYSLVKASIILFSLLLFVSSLSLLTFSQVAVISFNETIVSTTPQSISNHVYYLSLTVKGFTIINGTSVSSNITSMTGYISALGLPPLQLNSVPLTPPQAIGDNIYFAYVPGVSSITNLQNITKTNLAYANYTNGSWHIKNVITGGIVTGIFAYNNSLYALWKSSHGGETYLLSISQNNVIKNISINVPNASYIEVGNNVAVISNSSSSLNLQSLLTTGLNMQYYVINLSTGKVIYKIPDYNGNPPILVSVNNDLGLVSYTSVTGSPTGLSYLVLYNLSTNKTISEKSFYGTALGYINGKFILAYNEQVVGTSVIETLSVYNLTWVQLYKESETISPTSLNSPDGLFVNSSTVSILLTQISLHPNIQTDQVTENSSLKIINVFQIPKPFTINVSQQHYPGYTLLNISWNENQSDTYLVYVNNTLFAQTKSESIQYNATENGTYLVKVIAENPLGEIQENMTVNVTVYPVQGTSIITSTTTSNNTITTSTTTTSTTATTTISTTTTSSAITSSTSSPPTTTSSTTTSQSATSLSTSLVISIVLIVVIVIALAVFLARRK